MEGATKWDPAGWRTSDEVKRIYSQSKLPGNQVGVVLAFSALKLKLKKARSRNHELKTERQSSKKKLKHFLMKLSDERAMWRSQEHEKIRAIIDDMKADLHREKKNRQRTELVNSKLVNELADSKLLAKRFMLDCEKERNARELILEVCDELDDAKVMLEEKYSQMNKLLADMKVLINSKAGNVDAEEMKKVEVLLQAAGLMNIQDIRDFTYEPAHLDGFFAVFEDVNFREINERGVEPSVVYSPDSHALKIHTISPEISRLNKYSTMDTRMDAFVRMRIQKMMRAGGKQ